LTESRPAANAIEVQARMDSHSSLSGGDGSNQATKSEEFLLKSYKLQVQLVGTFARFRPLKTV
jgi:hypothetical protein